MKILVTGVTGQIGWELQRSLPALGTVVAPDRVLCDFTRPETVAAVMRDVRPDVVVNAAAYTDVDPAERDTATAMAVNAVSVGVLAEEGKQLGALLIHFSTDYVFDGEKSTAYVETDTPRPLGAYGRSKLAGEDAVRAGGGDHLILRTAWVYAARRRNFVRTILRLARQPAPLRVVDDQRGTPNWARTLADATGRIVARASEERRSGSFASGVFHLTASGVVSRYDFACAIVGQATRLDPQAFPRRPEIVPIATEPRPGVAARPQNSQLDGNRLAARFGIAMPDWQSDLTRCLEEITANGTRDGEPG